MVMPMPHNLTLRGQLGRQGKFHATWSYKVRSSLKKTRKKGVDSNGVIID